MKSISAFAPGTIANVNVGFDCLGLALNKIGDTVTVANNGKKYNKITNIIKGSNLPYDITKNCCTVVIAKMQEFLNDDEGVDVVVYKGFESSSGLGSSSASSAAAAFAFNKLRGNPCSLEQLVKFAAEGERVACGTAHLDNVACALLGGLTLINPLFEKAYIKLPFLPNLYVSVIYPKIKIKTEDSRKILRSTVPINQHTMQVALMGSFVSSLYEEDLERFTLSLRDMIVEPTRSMLIPEYSQVKKEAMDKGALTFGISGSGPSMFAFSKSESQAHHINESALRVYQKIGVEVTTFVDQLSKDGGTKLVTI